jgi:hypothetical protein
MSEANVQTKFHPAAGVAILGPGYADKPMLQSDYLKAGAP